MDNIRFILVVTFAMIVIMMWQAWQLDYGPKPEIVSSAVVNTKEDLPTTGISTQTESIAKSPELTTVAESNVSPKIIKIKTDVIAVEIDMQGGTLVNLDLLKYPVDKANTYVNMLRKLIGLSVSDTKYPPVRLFNSDPTKLFLAQSGLIAGKGFSVAPDHYSVFSSEKETYELSNGEEKLIVPITWKDESGHFVTKSFIFKRGSYEITLDQQVKNESGKPWIVRQYSQLLRIPDTGKQGNFLTGGMRAFDGGVMYTEKDRFRKISFEDMGSDEFKNVENIGGWVALIQHYFASAWIPPTDKLNTFYTKNLDNNNYVIGTFSPTISVDNNATTNFVTRLFAGPKIQPMMEAIAPGLELTVDYSVLTFIGKPIYWLLNKIHSIVGNWGWAIIGVTVCIKLIFFPLTQASFKSMAKMRKIQPRLKELQERFADDRQRFNKEMMEMYKKEKVNPLGGCLPILIQIPVFMALYWVLSETVEFRQAPFLLWIQDLSVQDPFFVFPIIMGITMKIQQGLNPAPIDPVQAKVMKMFPLVFTVFFLFFPAGLVLYWIVNNTLSIIQQSYITRQISKETKA
jgi:YidC/Oxa1 family membrane protein insertase